MLCKHSTPEPLPNPHSFLFFFRKAINSVWPYGLISSLVGELGKDHKDIPIEGFHMRNPGCQRFRPGGLCHLALEVGPFSPSAFMFWPPRKDSFYTNMWLCQYQASNPLEMGFSVYLFPALFHRRIQGCVPTTYVKFNRIHRSTGRKAKRRQTRGPETSVP